MRRVMHRGAGPLLAGLLLLLGGCGPDQPEAIPVPGSVEVPVDVVVGPGRVEPEGGVLPLGTDAGGRVARILATPGDSVAAGDPLVELEDEVEEARLGQARAEVESAMARVAAGAALVVLRELESAQASRELARVEELAREEFSSPEALEQARTREETLGAQVVEARAQRAVLEGNAEAARAAVALAQAELARRSILAPVDGVVLSVGVTVGSVLSGFQPVTAVELAPVGQPRVLAEIDELFAHLVRTGQGASVVDPGTGEVVARGTVVFVAPALSRKSLLDDAGGTFEDRRVREVHVRLEDPGRLLSGTRVEVRVEVDP